MPTLLSTKTGFINAVIEPQFQEFGTRTVVTLQFSEYDDVRKMRHHLLGDVTFDQHARMFPFTSFIQLDDLTSFFKRKSLWTELNKTQVDFSPEPVAYHWVAWYTGESKDEGEEFDENSYFGYCTTEDAEHIRWSFDELPDVLILYPLFSMPTELVRELEDQRQSRS